MYCSNSTYDIELGLYINCLQDENGNLFNVYGDDCIQDQWFVCVVSLDGCSGIEDVENWEIVGLSELK